MLNVIEKLNNKGYREEPKIPWKSTFLKPDIVDRKSGFQPLVLDVQVVSDSKITTLEEANLMKIRKYDINEIQEFADPWKKEA